MKNGWMGENDHRGWRGVTDPQHVLIAVNYDPVEGFLACRFCTGEPVIHQGVPEAKYLILLRSPFAGSYYRKHVKPKYPYVPGTEPPKRTARLDTSAIRRKQALQERQRLAASIPEVREQGRLF